MKKLIILLALVLPLGACANSQLGQFLTTGVANPVTKQGLYDFENGMILAFAGLNVYKKSCIAGAIPAGCRDVIVKLQAYTRQIPAELKVVRGYVKNNDTVNAQLAWATLNDLMTNFKAQAAANGVQVQ